VSPEKQARWDARECTACGRPGVEDVSMHEQSTGDTYPGRHCTACGAVVMLAVCGQHAEKSA